MSGARGELEVVSVNFGARAQRRLRRHAAAATVRYSGALVLDECVDLETQCIEHRDPSLSSASRVAAAAVSTSLEEGEERVVHRARSSPLRTLRLPSGQNVSSGICGAAVQPVTRTRPLATAAVQERTHEGTDQDRGFATQPVARQPALIRRFDQNRGPAVASGMGAHQGTEQSGGAAVSPAMAGHSSGSRVLPRSVSPTLSEASTQRTLPRSASPTLSESSTPSLSELSGRATPEDDVPPEHALVAFYVEPMSNGMEPRHCRRCCRAFDIHELRLGYAAVDTNSRLFAREVNLVPRICWVHAIGCSRRMAVRPQLDSSQVRFSRTVSSEDRRRIVSDLVVRSQQTGQQSVAAANWDYMPARLQCWDTWLLRAPQPQRRVPAPSLPSRIYLGDALEHRINAASLQSATTFRNGNDDGEDAEANEAVSHAAMQSMLEIVPLEKLSSTALEPCSICHEAMSPGEKCRRLPCFHLFHSACIERWLHLKGTCPLDKLLLKDMLRQQDSLQESTAAAVANSVRHRSRSARRQRSVAY